MIPALLCVVVFASPPVEEPLRAVLLSDLPPEVRSALDAGGEAAEGQGAGADPYALLERVFRAGTPYRFESRWADVYTDRRWYSTEPVAGDDAPFLVVRRWPGDSVAAFYRLGPAGDVEGSGPGRGCPLVDPTSGPEAPGGRIWDGTLETRLGPRPASWAVVGHEDVPAGRIGALLVPGSAGLGPEAPRALRYELLMLLGRTRWKPEGWGADGSFADANGRVAPPPLGDPARAYDERTDPWQIAIGPGFTLGLPPGVLSRQVGPGLPVPSAAPGALLWFRGRFVDRDAHDVAIGDGERAGYVAVSDGADDAWVRGEDAPLGVPGATRLAAQPYDLLSRWNGCREASAQRWSEPGFAGQWLLFRMAYENGTGVEIGMPVLAGRRSLALFWIPATWRGPGLAPAPPPVDPAARFGITFEPEFGERRRGGHPFTEGYLSVPGLRLSVSKGWWPVATLRSTRGFPVRIVDSGGAEVGRLVPLAAEEVARQAGQDGWQALDRPKKHRAAAVYAHPDGSRLFVDDEGQGFLVRASLPDGDPEAHSAWERVVDSVKLNRSGRGPDRSD